jgi:hypothetical protein
MSTKSWERSPGGRKAFFSAAALAAALIFQLGPPAQLAQASIDLPPLYDAPLISIGFVGVQYDLPSEQFQAGGYSQEFTDIDGHPYSVADGSFTSGIFSLDATITSSGTLLGGSFSIDGGPSGSPDPLLTGSLTDLEEFGGGGTTIFALFFNSPGGSAASSFPAGGVVKIYPLDPNLPAGFSQSFSSAYPSTLFGPGSAKTGVPVPEPMSLAVWGVLAACGGGIGLIARFPRKR